MKSSFRISIIAVFFLNFAAIIIASLFYWQIIQGANLSAQASSQRESLFRQSPARGNILSSDGFPLAISQEGYTLWANPQKINSSPSNIAELLAPIISTKLDEVKIATDSSQEDIENLEKSLLSESKNFIVNQLSKIDLIWVLLNKKTTKEEKTKIDSLQIQGLNYDNESIRAYPEASMASQLLGFIGQDEAGQDIGYFGLEGFYDLDLSGRIGIVKQEKDALNRPIPIGKFWSQKKRDGRHLQLYLDRSIQFIVQEKLKEAVKKYEAKSGSVVIMDPKTGGILAMASYPDFDPNTFSKYDSEYYINPVVSLSYEPGSTFKIITVASGIEEQLITPETRCDICDKPFKVDQYTIRTWNDKYHPNSTITEGLINSDNVAMVFVSQKLGIEKFKNYIEKFGIGQLTNIDLQGEIAPSLRNSWSNVDLYTSSFGQGILVTPIQMLSAASAIANDGKLMTPRIVQKFVENEDEIPIDPKIVRQVISKETADTLTQMMVEVAAQGDAKWAIPKGYKIAGKTGTAQVSIGGEYDSEKTIASFVGFAPADNPAFVMLTIIQEPKTSEWGSETAAPLFFDIVKKLFIYLGIPAQN